MTPEIDLKMMLAALRQAQLAFDAGEVPVGAVVALGDRIIGRGHNMTEALHDITAHAEMQAITAATQTLGSKYLRDCTLYVTLEPCLMCAGAIAWSQVSRVVWGADDPRRGFSYLTRSDRPALHPRTEISRGLMADDCLALVRAFFASRR